MRALAEFVMKGHSRAVITAVLATGSALFAWLGAAVIALVTLRRGAARGSTVLAWAMVPAVVLAAVGDAAPATTLIGVTLASVVLRTTMSWPYALLAAVFSGVVTATLLATIAGAYTEQIRELLAQMLQQMATNAGNEAAVTTPGLIQVAGFLGFSNAATVALCLMLARWWQALLYNPGGFRAEMHRLRLSPPLTIGLLVAGLAMSALGTDFALWAVIFMLPFVFAGFGLVHGLMAKRQLGGHWLVVFYLAWLLLGPVKIALIVLAVADSWLDMRSRIPAAPDSD